MTPRLVHLNNQNAVGKLRRHEVEKHLETVGVQVTELIEKVRSSRRFDNAIQVERLKLPLHFAPGFNPPSCDFATTESFEPDPGFVLAPEAHSSR